MVNFSPVLDCIVPPYKMFGRLSMSSFVTVSLQFQREKLNTAEDQNSMMSRLAGQRIEQTNDDFDVDDMFESRAQRGVDSVAAEARDRQRAIRDHEKREKILDSCAYCFDSPVRAFFFILSFSHLNWFQ